MIKDNLKTNWWALIGMFIVALIIIPLCAYTTYLIESENDIYLASKAISPKKIQVAKDQSSWETYENKVANFSFKYPRELEVNPVDPKQIKGKFISVTVEKMSEIGDQPSGFDQESAYKDKAALEKDDASTRVGWSMGATKLKLADVIGKEQVQLAAFDVSVGQLSRMAIIYKDGYRVLISLIYSDVPTLIKNNPQYFSSDPVSGDTWKEGQIDTFYTDLKVGQTDSITQDWYETFDQIIATFNSLAESTSNIVYQNSDYGFEITFPDTWEGYKVKKEKSGAEWIFYFGVKTNDSNFKDDGTTADGGYFSPFAIGVQSLDEWEKIKDESKSALIMKNSDYAFTWAQSNGIQPDDYDKSGDIKKIIDSFKIPD